MPNLAFTRINFIGNETDIKELKEKVKTEYSPFSFTKIIPVPESLYYNIDVDKKLAVIAYFTKNGTIPMEQEEKKLYYKMFNINLYGNIDVSLLDGNLYNEDGSLKIVDVYYEDGYQIHLTLEDAGKFLVDKFKNYGAMNAYDWKCQYWWTKWDANDVKIIENTKTNFCISFVTAWSSPGPIFRKISDMFPNISFEVECVDEQLYSSLLKFKVKNGIFKFEDIDTAESDEIYTDESDENEEIMENAKISSKYLVADAIYMAKLFDKADFTSPTFISILKENPNILGNCDLDIFEKVIETKEFFK